MKKAGLQILHKSTKRVQVVNGDTSKAVHATQLPFPQLSPQASQANTFKQFPTSLMSVGKTSDDGTISIFTKPGITVHKELDVPITCKGNPIVKGFKTNMEVTKSHLSNRKDSGNHNDPPKWLGRHYNKQTVYTISHPPSKQSNGYTQYADSQ